MKVKSPIVSVFLFLLLASLFLRTNAKQITNHLYAGVNIAYAKSDLTECSFQYSPIDFCDKKHLSAINQAIAGRSANFNGHFILLVYPEWSQHHQQSVMAIDTITGIVYPLPIDAFSGLMYGRSIEKDRDVIKYSISSKKVCINGAILVYRAFKEGNFCFEFSGDKFTGHHTEYMYP